MADLEGERRMHLYVFKVLELTPSIACLLGVNVAYPMRTQLQAVSPVRCVLGIHLTALDSQPYRRNCQRATASALAAFFRLT